MSLHARLWIVPANDLEALAISGLLREHGESLLITHQPWGASWQGLEPEIQESLLRFRADHPEGVIYGVELAGPNTHRAIDIDHHFYSGDDRRAAASSLEQVANLLGVELTPADQRIAINDRAWIPGLLASGATAEEIAEIRARDRRAQGVTEQQEIEARRDIDSATRTAGTWLVECPDGQSSAHADFLFERLGRVEPVLLMGPARWTYSGPRARDLAALNLPEPHWAGGEAAYGYFGIQRPSSASQRVLLDTLSRG